MRIDSWERPAMCSKRWGVFWRNKYVLYMFFSDTFILTSSLTVRPNTFSEICWNNYWKLKRSKEEKIFWICFIYNCFVYLNRIIVNYNLKYIHLNIFRWKDLRLIYFYRNALTKFEPLSVVIPDILFWIPNLTKISCISVTRRHMCFFRESFCMLGLTICTEEFWSLSNGRHFQVAPTKIELHACICDLLQGDYKKVNYKQKLNF